ncbi:MAG: hypothetical protein JOZ44_08690 [Acidobacteria bacterium]|nr:hypothetical protein [Acidobacteriota bacterium]
MAGRIRTAKSLGQRHDFHYFQRWGRWRFLRAFLMIAVPAIAGLWLLGFALHHDSEPYASGPLSTVHSFTGKRCGTCHRPVIEAGFLKVGFRQHVDDAACLSCHQAPAHQALQTFTPTCASCHVEHTGSQHLRQTADETCVQCHGELKVKSGSPRYQTAIYDFDKKHPEFAPLRTGFGDPGTIKLNHSVHMRAGLLGPNAQPVQMQCQDCHRTPADQSAPWKYGESRLLQTSLQSGSSADPHNPAMPEEPTRPGIGRAYMAAPTYASACQNCHALQFDSHFTESAPHDKPQVVHDFIVRRLTEYIHQHPEAIHETPRPLRVMFGGTISREPQTPRIARSADEWVRIHTEDAENLLWRKTCQECHTLRFSPNQTTDSSALPEVAPSQIKAVWLPNSVFSHYAHAGVNCQSCHTKALASTETQDVLIPSITTCQQCHNGNPVKLGQSENGCFLCHQYHNWKQSRGPFIPTHTMDQLRGAAPQRPSTEGIVASQLFLP